jgi:chorismate-pyruvate lyase
MSLLDPALLDPLSRFHPAEEAEFESVSPEGLSSEMRRLLVHGGDMTSRLEALHGSAIRLEVLKSEHAGEALYSREVLLRSASSGRAVEYGAIQIFLDAFEPAVRTKILEGRIPLGGILNSSGMRYYSEPQAFFFVRKGRRLAGLLEVESSAGLCGRCNVLRGEGGETLARIVEVVPPVPPGSMPSPGLSPLESSAL